MKLSFENLRQASKQHEENHKLFAIVMGIRGAGKSTVLGTLGVKTFLIASASESHAVTASKLYGGENIISSLYDVDETGKQLKADLALANLHNLLDFLLTSEDLLENIECVALDSFSAIDKTLMETSQILQEKNTWAQMDMMEMQHLKIIKKLKELHRRGLHVVTTMPILGTFDENNLYVTAKQDMRGIRTPSTIISNFPEVLVICRPEREYCFQMDLTMKKTGKTVSGEDKVFITHPRITGLGLDDLLKVSPDLLIPADLNYIYQLKQAKGA